MWRVATAIAITVAVGALLIVQPPAAPPASSPASAPASSSSSSPASTLASWPVYWLADADAEAVLLVDVDVGADGTWRVEASSPREEVVRVRTPVLAMVAPDGAACSSDGATALAVVAAYDALRRHGMLFPDHVLLAVRGLDACAPPSRALLDAAFPHGAVDLTRLAPGFYAHILVSRFHRDGGGEGGGGANEATLAALRHQLGRRTVVAAPEDEDDAGISAWMAALAPVRDSVSVVLPKAALHEAALAILGAPTASLVVVLTDRSGENLLETLADRVGVRLAVLPACTTLEQVRTIVNVYRGGRVLLYAPWEQLGNQRLALLSACATAVLLNRTLVVPDVGYRDAAAAADARGYVAYDPRTYTWLPVHTVWDAAAMAELPCRWITQRTFGALGIVDETDAEPLTVRYHALSGGTTTEQVLAYYQDVAHLPVTTVAIDAPTGEYELTSAQILDLHGARSDRVLALGVLFRYYDFGVPRPPVRPARDYIELVEQSPLYAAIAAALVPTAVVRAVANAFRRQHLRGGRGDGGGRGGGGGAGEDRDGGGVKGAGGDREGGEGDAPPGLMCTHLRRADYLAKCKHFEPGSSSDADAARERCVTPTDVIARTVYASRPLAALYVSSDAADVAELGPLAPPVAAAWTADALAYGRSHWPADAGPFTPVHSALVDQELCIAADLFWGNAFSSFSTTIFNRRALAGRPSAVLLAPHIT